MEVTIDDPPSYILAIIFVSSFTYYSIGGGLLVVLLILSAMVSGSEVAFFSLDPDHLDSSLRSNKTADKAIVKLLKHPKQLLATILILNNTINVAIITLATFMMWRITGSQTTEGRIIVILTLCITFFIVFFGEVIPKVYATQNNLKFARRTSLMLSVFNTILIPMSMFLMAISNVVETRLKKKGYDISMKELSEALEITTDKETSEEEKEIIRSIIAFGTISARQVMRSRVDITGVDIEIEFDELLKIVNDSGYSRIPAYRESIDNIEGILYIKDLLPHLNKGEKFQWQKLLRPGYFVPENKKIDTLLRDFQVKRVHMAIVVDEYGGTSGLITLEDVIEEIVGEIKDEFDEDEIAHHKLDESTYIFEGKTSLNDFCKIVGEEPSVFEEVKGESESLGGLILELHSKLPQVEEKIVFGKYVFTVEAVDKRRIKKIKVFINESTGDEETTVAKTS